MLLAGLIQPETIPGNFPKNLRSIVELYRTCLDQGANIVICPPLALSGVHLGELALHEGFRTQQQAALNYLAKEISAIPLLMGALDTSRHLQFYLFKENHIQQIMQPYPPQLDMAAPQPLGLFNNPGEQEYTLRPVTSPMEGTGDQPSLLLRFPMKPWHQGCLEQDEESARTLAQHSGIPVLTGRLAGGEGPYLLPGASSVLTGTGKVTARLKLFQRDAATVTVPAPPHPINLPSPSAQIQQAIRTGIRDFIFKAGYEEICLNLLEGTASRLIVRLLTEFIPAKNITGVIPCMESTPEKLISETQMFAEQTGIRTTSMARGKNMTQTDINDEQLTACQIRQWADEQDALWLSCLNKTESILNRNAARCAMMTDFMPLGNLFESDLHVLFPSSCPPGHEQDHPDHILIPLLQDHISATHLTALHPEQENRIRWTQRMCREAEWTISKLPPRLILHAPCPAPGLPAIHQLRD